MTRPVLHHDRFRSLHSLRDLLLIVTFYAVGALIFVHVEDWTFFQSIYFISSTVSTVGYGDLHPKTSFGQIYCCLMIFLGVTLVFTTIQKYIDFVHEVIHTYHERWLGLFGLKFVDVDRLPIYKCSPAEVEAMIWYPSKFAQALAPLFFLLIIAFTIGKAAMGLSVVESLYFTVVTCTTIGYGEIHPARSTTRAFFSVFLLFLCIVVTKTGADLYHIIVKRKIRIGESQPDIENMLLCKAFDSPKAKGESLNISESEFIVEALLREKLVDRQVLLAVRRTYYWVARAGNGNHTNITPMDLYEQHRSQEYTRKRQRQSFARRAIREATRVVSAAHERRRRHVIATSPQTSPREEDDDNKETFDEWLTRYWEPRVVAAQEAGLRAYANDRSMSDPFAVEKARRTSTESIMSQHFSFKGAVDIMTDIDVKNLLLGKPAEEEKKEKRKKSSFFFRFNRTPRDDKSERDASVESQVIDTETERQDPVTSLTSSPRKSKRSRSLLYAWRKNSSSQVSPA